jgi:hypothetical protein
MIYGRRVIESQQRLNKTGSQRKTHVKDRSFQIKYSLFLMAAVAGSSLIFLLPALYYVQENFEIFFSLAYKNAPALLENLEREILWLKIYFAISSLFTIGLCSYIGYKLTGNILGPLIAIEKHMLKVTRGDWSSLDFRIRAHDDYRTLADTYSYLYKSLRAQTEQELKWLEKIVIDPQNREAVAAWEALVQTKQAQLGINQKMKPAIEAVEGSASSLTRRHAS